MFHSKNLERKDVIFILLKDSKYRQGNDSCRLLEHWFSVPHKPWYPDHFLPFTKWLLKHFFTVIVFIISTPSILIIPKQMRLWHTIVSLQGSTQRNKKCAFFLQYPSQYTCMVKQFLISLIESLEVECKHSRSLFNLPVSLCMYRLWCKQTLQHLGGRSLRIYWNGRANIKILSEWYAHAVNCFLSWMCWT